MPKAAKTLFDPKLFLEALANCGEGEMTEDFVGVSNIDQQVRNSGEHVVSITAHHGIYR
jgi:hypothetical protein